MLRVVSLHKAALAGVAGAVGWEVAVRLLKTAGVPAFDLVHALGTVAFPDGSTIEWWLAGMAAHCIVGICWAVFYGYFFWARLDLRPTLQGVAFAIIPACLALAVALPQIHLMHLDQQTVRVDWSLLTSDLSPRVLASVAVGHLIFGLCVGAIYNHPVGYPADEGHKPDLASPRRPAPPHAPRPPNARFIFATGIECSYPTIEHGRWRRDELSSTRHYEYWPEDFELARALGITHIRYGPPLHLVFRGPASYDWSLVDGPMQSLIQAGPEPIVDLCHFGLPSWLGNFQNPEMVDALAEYAGAFARRYPAVRFYTPVNEMFVCARNSTLNGIWNEQAQSEAAFVNAVFNLASASVAMTDAILKERPDAIFINSESSEFSQPCCPDENVQRIARFENERRFLPLDLIYAHPVSDDIRSYLREQGRADGDIARFMSRAVPRRSVIGVDYYEWNERLINQHGDAQALGELFGWYVIASQYYDRYQRTMMYTETNRMDAADASRWLWRQWHNLQLLRSSGVPIIGFTWYSLTDQIDWDIGMQKALGAVYPVGLFDLNRDPRSVGLSYKYLIDMYRDEPDYCECPALKALLD